MLDKFGPAKGLGISLAAGAAVLVGASAVSATTVNVTSGGIYQPGTITVAGPGLNSNEFSSALDLTATLGAGPQVHTLYTFCVDLFHSINVGFDNAHDIVTGAGDAQLAYAPPLVYHIAALTVDSNGPISGVSGSLLTATQIAEIGGLANLGGQLIATDASDLSNKLAAVQGAIWDIEYPAYSVSAPNSTVQNYLLGYVANAYAGRSLSPVYAIYGPNGQGLIPTGGVPEPATWAVMLVGFGLAGATLRRRRALASI